MKTYARYIAFSLALVFLSLLKIMMQAQIQQISCVPKSNDVDIYKANNWTKECAPDSDCAQFQDLLKHWPDGKPKAAIYYLIECNKLDQLKASLQSLDAFFNKQFQYPVILFHESESTLSLDVIRGFTSSKVFFQEVIFQLPEFIKNPPRKVCGKNIDFRHMCRFQAKTVMELPIFEGLDWYMRLDTDSFLLRPINYDIFYFMVKNNLLYGYMHMVLENKRCIQGLHDKTKYYLKLHHLKPTFYNKQPEMFYSNFEIAKISLWRNPSYKRYISYIDLTGGIYFSGWSDAPIRTVAYSIFYNKNDTHHFKDIAYEHQDFRNTWHVLDFFYWLIYVKLQYT